MSGTGLSQVCCFSHSPLCSSMSSWHLLEGGKRGGPGQSKGRVLVAPIQDPIQAKSSKFSQPNFYFPVLAGRTDRQEPKSFLKRNRAHNYFYIIVLRSWQSAHCHACFSRRKGRVGVLSQGKTMQGPLSRSNQGLSAGTLGQRQGSPPGCPVMSLPSEHLQQRLHLPPHSGVSEAYNLT